MKTQDELARFFEGFSAQRVAEQQETEEDDDVDSPAHYHSLVGTMEAIDVIEAYNLNFNLGNAIKYILRSGKKDDEIQDLKKAMWYLKREIKILDDEV